MADRRELLALLREDFHFFLVWAFHVLHPGAPFQDNWHIDAIAHHLTKICKGEILRLLITMPPRSLKSHSVSVAFIAWQLGRDPSSKFMCASYGETLSGALAQQTRKLMQHDDYRATFPLTIFSQKSPDMLATTQGGYRFATSVTGGGTGIGTDFLIVDDLVKASASALQREQATAFFTDTLLSRLDNKTTGRVIVVGQRIALDDLPGYLIDQGNYTHLNLPAIALTTEKIETGPGKFKLFYTGEYLHETREGRETLARVRKELGEETFSAQYLQRPNAAQGAILDPHWFPAYETRRPLWRYPYKVLSVDTALSDSGTADYSVGSIFGGDESFWDLLYVWRDRVGMEKLSTTIGKLICEHEITHVIVERSAAGFGLLEELHKKYAYGVIPFIATMSKEERVHRCIPFFRDQKIRLPQSAPWLSSFKGELLSFPNVAYDDQIDTLVQFVYCVDSILGRDRLTLRGSDDDWGEVWMTGEARRRRSV